MKRLLFKKCYYSLLSLLIALFIAMPAGAAQGGGNLGSSKSVPVEVGLYKSTILSLKKKIALVTLATTKKQESESDYTVTYEKTSKEDLKNDPELLPTKPPVINRIQTRINSCPLTCSRHTSSNSTASPSEAPP